MTMNPLRLVPQTVPPADPDAPRKAPASKRRNTHRGVFILKPEKRNRFYRVRYTDPETDEQKKERIPEHQAKTVDTRRNYAVALAKKLNSRRDEIRAGARPHAEADTALDVAIDGYFATWGARKRPGTQSNYRSTCDAFVEWCSLPAVNVRTVRQLSKGHLSQWTLARAGAQIKASTVNRDLKNLSAVLNKLRAGEVIRMTRDDIADGLKSLDTEHERREFYRVGELAAIVAACRAHDTERPGESPALPLVLFLLLTGLRVSEALAIEWRDIGDDEITVRTGVSKTKHARTIDLHCTPLLAALVSERANHRPSDLVLSGWSRADIHAVRKLLTETYGAPVFTSQGLRCTCGTFLTCAPSIFGAASAYMSAKRLGHSVKIAEKHYTGVARVSPEARTIEAAMQLDVTPASCPRL